MNSNGSNLGKDDINCESGLHVPRGKLWHQLKNQSTASTSDSYNLIQLSSDDDEYVDINGNRTGNNSKEKTCRGPIKQPKFYLQMPPRIQKSATLAAKNDNRALLQCSSKNSSETVDKSLVKIKKRTKGCRKSRKVDSCSILANQGNERKRKSRIKKDKSKAKKAKLDATPSTSEAKKNSAVKITAVASLPSQRTKNSLCRIHGDKDIVKDLGKPKGIIDDSNVRMKAVVEILDKIECLPVQTPQTISLDDFWQAPPHVDKDNVMHLTSDKRKVVEDKLRKTDVIYPISALLICKTNVMTNEFYVPETTTGGSGWNCCFIESSDSYQLVDTIFAVANESKLAMQAAAAKFIQVYFGEEQMAKDLLSNYMNNKRSRKLYKDPIFEDAACNNDEDTEISTSLDRENLYQLMEEEILNSTDTCKKRKLSRSTSVSSNHCETFTPYILIPLDNPIRLANQRLNMKKENKMLRNKLESLKHELREIGKHTFQNQLNYQSLVQPSLSDHYDTLISLQTLRKVEFVDSLSIDIKAERRTDMLKLYLHVSDRYTFTCEPALGFEAAMLRAIELAGDFMQSVKAEGREILIPRSSQFNTAALVSLLELQTGIPLESVDLSFYTQENGQKYGGKLIINETTCEYKDKRSKEVKRDIIISNLLHKYLIEHLGFKVV